MDDHPVKYSLDLLAMAGSASVLFGLLTNFLGFLAAICSLVWAASRAYDSRFGKAIVNFFRKGKSK